ncbi:TetR/AcrR family transcriptional regulator [Lacticaseibacillus daqingensis]|uniref:TetR/AcrR family transcriptional regulator n=1 Tax=Lacticaseibacillus daqingensis TaxID=2486014 RepID=UPI000F768567|nr:TetR/AcrR family transcriptional regulator [Lacticaseibacillus daqingensis]
MTTNETLRTQQKAGILEVARQLFAAQGYQATTTRQINAAFRGSEGLLYYYFRQGKREILDAVIAQGADWPLPKAWRLGAPQTPAALEQQLLAGLETWWQVMLTPAVYETILILIRERPQLTDEQVAWCTQRERALHDDLANALAALPAPYVLTPRRADATATLIVGLYQRVVLENLLIAGQPRQAVDLFAELQPSLHALIANWEASDVADQPG